MNPSSAPVTVTIAGQQVVPSGGGAVDTGGDEPGTVTTTAVTSVTLAATSAAIVLNPRRPRPAQGRARTACDEVV